MLNSDHIPQSISTFTHKGYKINVTEFWKITLMGVPEIIRIFECTTILLTSQKPFF